MNQSKELRTLQLSDYATLIEDINYNFSVLLSSPLFQGVQGKPGTPGTPGKSGIRGTKWMFADFVRLNSEFPEIDSPTKITSSFLLSKIQSNTDSPRLYAALNGKTQESLSDTDYFVEGDIIVANAKIYVYDGFAVRDTRESVNGSTAYNIEEIVSSMLQNKIKDIQSLQENLNALVQYSISGKNFPDSSNQNNLVQNRTTAIDVATSDPNLVNRPGLTLSGRKMYGISEGYVDAEDFITFLMGSPEKYHSLIQSSLDSAPTSTTPHTTSEFAPNVSGQPIAVFLQNDLESGLLIGFKNADNFTAFAKIYVNSAGELVIMPPVKTIESDVYAKIKLSPNRITLDGDVNITGALSTKNSSGGTSFYSASSAGASRGNGVLGDMKKDTHILGRRVAIPYLAGTQFLTMSVDGWLKGSDITLSDKQTIDSESVSTKIIPNTQQIHALNKKINDLKETVNNSSNPSVNFVDDALLPALGSITDIICIDDFSYSTLISNLFDENGRGKEDCSYTLFSGRVVHTNLSSYVICDGRLAPELPRIEKNETNSYHKFSIMYIGH